MKELKLFCITADYRKPNSQNPKYYVFAKQKTEAKKIFKDIITWLNVYNVEECELEYPIDRYRYSVLNYYDAPYGAIKRYEEIINYD